MRTIILLVFGAALAWSQISFPGGGGGTTPWTACASGCDGTITASPMTITAGTAKGATTHGHGTAPIVACYATGGDVIATGSTNCAVNVGATGTVTLTYSSAPALIVIYGGGTRGQAGSAGAAGATGPPVSMIGDWAVDVTYAVGDAVTHLGSSYISTAAGNVGHTPTDGTPWAVLAQRGADGVDGTSVVVGAAGIAADTAGGTTTVSIDTASVPQYSSSTGLPSTLADYATATPGQRFHSTIDTGVQRLFWARGPSDWPEILNLVSGRVAATYMPALTGDITSSAGTVATALAAKHITRQFGFMLGAEDGSALADTNDQPDIFINQLGSGIHITKISCRTDSATALTMNLQRNDGSAADILSSNLSCSSTLASSSTFTSGEDVISDGHGINLVVVSAGGGAKRLTIIVKYTVD
jgi:hypothetical protein